MCLTTLWGWHLKINEFLHGFTGNLRNLMATIHIRDRVIFHLFYVIACIFSKLTLTFKIYYKVSFLSQFWKKSSPSVASQVKDTVAMNLRLFTPKVLFHLLGIFFKVAILSRKMVTYTLIKLMYLRTDGIWVAFWCFNAWW